MIKDVGCSFNVVNQYGQEFGVGLICEVVDQDGKGFVRIFVVVFIYGYGKWLGLQMLYYVLVKRWRQGVFYNLCCFGFFIREFGGDFIIWKYGFVQFGEVVGYKE